MKNNVILSVLMLATAATWVGGCSRGNRPAANPGAPVLVAQAIRTNVPVQISPLPVGHVLPYSTVTIRAQIGGTISEVHFQQGQAVKQGDPLFTIDPRPSQAALDQARAALTRDQAQLEYARVNLAREQKLFDQKLISQDELDTNRANFDALAGTVTADEAAVTNAMLNLSYCEIRSPIDGITGSLQFYQGNVVKAPDDTLITVNQIHPIFVEFAVPEQYLPQIRREMATKTLAVAARYENLQGPPPQGELTFVDNSVDPATGTIRLRGTFPNESSRLWPGQFVQVLLTLSELTNVVAVPTQAIQTGQNGSFVYVVKPDAAKSDDTVEERAVVTGITYRGQTVVEHGVEAGETVVTDGQLRLTPGVKVNIKSAMTSTNAP